MISNVKVAAVQMSCSDDREENIAKAERMVRQAASDGANVILLPELFELPYFCQEKNYDYYYLADKTEENPAVKRFMQVAKETGTVIPVSFYEKHGNAFFNTIAMIDCDGSLMGIYRKSHIPDDHSIRRSSTSHRATQASRCGIQSSAVSVSVYAGISGFRRRHAVWLLWAQICSFTPPLSAVSLYWSATRCPTGEGLCRVIQRQTLFPLSPQTE